MKYSIDHKPFPRFAPFVVLSIALLLGLVCAPALIAQSAASSVAIETKNGEQSLNAEEKNAQTQAEEGDDRYRHSATVKWIAKTFGLQDETAAKGFEYINFAVIVLAVGIPLFNVLPKMLRTRSETLSKDLESARAATADANARLSAVEAKLAGLDAEINAIRKQVEEDIQGDEVRIKASIEEDSARIVAAAEQEIMVAAALAQRGLKQFAADLAIDRALSRLTLDAKTDSAMIAEFAREVTAGKIHGGDQN